MKKIILTLITACIFCTYSHAQTQNPAHQWFEDARFGMFVHLGPYSVLADGEWIMQNKPYTVAQYRKLQHAFDPRLFDAKEYVQIAKAAGMKYITFTSRHHDS
ncbi:MAG: alpha-L-fucosidase, partial [Bacteroidales bacterium]|nr:alpha-L-fucosidase [Bacteroidales bacterium]